MKWSVLDLQKVRSNYLKKIRRCINLGTPTEKWHQYLVDPPFAEITASKHFLKPPMRVWILVEFIFDHSSLQNISSSVRCDGFRAWTARYKSHHRCSIIFRSGDWDGHSRTFYLFLCMNSIVDFEWCLGSLSGWNIQPLCKLHFVTDSWTLFARICWYWLESMRPSTFARTCTGHTAPQQDGTTTIFYCG